jgi:alpha-tubulin suppressor-like RCC1 family protein
MISTNHRASAGQQARQPAIGGRDMHTPQLTRRAERGAAGGARLARLVSSLILALSALAGLFSPPQLGGGGGGLLPLRAAQASSPDLQAAIAGGLYHTCALKGGQVYCWGLNNYGQLGDGTTTQRNTPTLVADGEMGNSGVTAVAAGLYHTCALKGGQVYCWGWNGSGQLGDETNTNRNTPTLVAGGEMGNSGVTAVAASGYHICALKGGQVYCWGWNWEGQLGDGTNTNRNTPTLVAGGEMGNSGVTAVAAGGSHTCALKGGQVYCWGYNSAGQLGNGTNTDSTTPTLVAGGAMGNSGVTAVAAVGSRTCALKGGQVYCWGWNGYGQLGDNTTTQRTTPTLVAGGAMGNSGVTAVAAGTHHTLGLKQDTCLFAWGQNAGGQLGDGTTTDRTTPVQVSGGCGWGITTQASSPDLQAAIAAGWEHTCALKGGQVYCWGLNNHGQLGNGTTTSSNTPTLVANGAMGNSGVTAVAAGGYHT